MKLIDLVTSYVDFRQALGEKFLANQAILRSFCQAAGPQTPITRVRPKRVEAFLGGTSPMTSRWHRRYSVLKGLFQFAVSRGHLNHVPLPGTLPKRQPTLVPYIYSREELRRLLEAVPSCPRFPKVIEPPTMRAILLTFYGAGLRRQEVLDLSLAHVDLPNRLLTIQDTKFFKSRLVPIGHDLANALTEYASWRAATHPATDAGSHFFVSRKGAAIHPRTLQYTFAQLRERAGVRRSDGGRYQPRLHDLRHTFAVHRLTAWYQQGADVQRLVHHLSVYLGHAELANTQVYLTMTPELLEQASTRFERYARGEGGHA
jgi:integrase/recombinase XerD